MPPQVLASGPKKAVGAIMFRTVQMLHLQQFFVNTTNWEPKTKNRSSRANTTIWHDASREFKTCINFIYVFLGSGKCNVQ